MKLKTGLWIADVLLAVAFIIFTYMNLSFCNLEGFLLYSQTEWFSDLLFICNHTGIISYSLVAIILIISVTIIYLNKRVDK